MIPFSSYQKESYIVWIIYDQGSIGKEIARKRNTILLNRVRFDAQNIKVSLVCTTLRLRIELGKWLAKFPIEDGVCQTLLRRKYVGSRAISQVY
jgi:hypothetical protein